MISNISFVTMPVSRCWFRLTHTYIILLKPKYFQVKCHKSNITLWLQESGCQSQEHLLSSSRHHRFGQGLSMDWWPEAFPPNFLDFLNPYILLSPGFYKPQVGGTSYSEITFLFLDPTNYVSKLKLVWFFLKWYDISCTQVLRPKFTSITLV